MREKMNLDGVWDFQWYGEEKPTFPMEFSDVAAVPGCFDVTEPYCGNKGYAVYRRYVYAGGAVRLNIDGLGVCGEVYWDQVLIGECKYAYMPEDMYFDAGVEGLHELTVLIDNRYNDHFEPFFDFYGYGGIYGSVTLERMPEAPITKVLISTEDIHTGTVSLHAEAADGYSGKAWISFDTGAGGEHCFSEGKLDVELQVPDFHIWDTEHPYVHTLKLKTETDEVEEKFGIRQMTAEGRKILLNGKPIKLIGYNRHESFPNLGAAVPVAQMVADLKLIKEQGCNFVRGSHYAQRRTFLELCDKMGMLVWEETIGWGIKPSRLQNQEFLEAQKTQVRRLTELSFNNPSVVIRGYLNECASEHVETREIIKALYDEIRAIDKNCLISFATYKYQKDVCIDLVDVVSMNCYPGWYGATFEKPNAVEDVRPFLEQLSADMPMDKPFLVTEIGAEGLYGFRDPLKLRWSEEYQSDLLLEACRYVLESDDCAGISIWHFSDARSFVTGPEIMGRARGFNNKGVMDEYRRPKLAWYTLKEMFLKYKNQQNN